MQGLQSLFFGVDTGLHHAERRIPFCATSACWRQKTIQKRTVSLLTPPREELAAFRRCSASKLHAAPLRDPLRIPERVARTGLSARFACCCALQSIPAVCSNAGSRCSSTGRSAFILSLSQYRTGSRTTFLPPFLSRLAAENGDAVTRMKNFGMKNEIMQ